MLNRKKILKLTEYYNHYNMGTALLELLGALVFFALLFVTFMMGDLP